MTPGFSGLSSDCLTKVRQHPPLKDGQALAPQSRSLCTVPGDLDRLLLRQTWETGDSKASVREIVAPTLAFFFNFFIFLLMPQFNTKLLGEPMSFDIKCKLEWTVTEKESVSHQIEETE